METILAETDQIFEMIAGHSPLWIYVFVFISMTIENFFPPYPGDVTIFLCGVYAAGGHASWTLVYLLSLAGTMTSVMALYYLGHKRGRAILANNKLRFLGLNRQEKLESWFSRWGEKLLLVSRFLAGTRALLALLAGIGNVRPWRMFLYSLISAAAFNFLILYLALVLRRDWQKIDSVLSTYNIVLWIAGAVLVLIIGGRILLRRRKATS
jgi:membrane protein DedA with SNARE-associated domain